MKIIDLNNNNKKVRFKVAENIFTVIMSIITGIWLLNFMVINYENEINGTIGKIGLGVVLTGLSYLVWMLLGNGLFNIIRDIVENGLKDYKFKTISITLGIPIILLTFLISGGVTRPNPLIVLKWVSAIWTAVVLIAYIVVNINFENENNRRR